MRSRLKWAVRRLSLRPSIAPPFTFDDYIQERVGVWQSAPPLDGALIFLGDSQIERGFWSEWWARGDILNRGIGSQTTRGITGYLDEVARHQPRLIVLECGTNDLATGTSVEAVAGLYAELLRELSTHAPSALLWPQSVLPAHPIRWRSHSLAQATRECEKLNAQIQELNALLAPVAAKRGLPFLDVSAVLEENGELNRAYTFDGTHLNGEGYRVWRAAMKQNAPPEIAAILGAPRE